MNLTGAVTTAMIAYESGNARRINHFLKVYGFAKAIGEMEILDERNQLILEVAALTHDIGIKPSLEKFGSGAGMHQQTEGPPVAEPMLRSLGADAGLIERVCWLIAHHHTYDDIQGLDYQILVEADFLVNIFEGSMEEERRQTVRATIFRTETGLNFFDHLFPSETVAQ